jgi:cytochrome c553
MKGGAMKGRGNHALGAAMLCGIALGAGLSVAAQPPNKEVRSLSATCAACHGTDGHAVSGPPMLRLAGKLKSDFVRQMRSFRDGSRAATVMQQIAKGYDDAQTEALGDFFAAQR